VDVHCTPAVPGADDARHWSPSLTLLTRLAALVALLLAVLGTYSERWGLTEIGRGAPSSFARPGETAPPFSAPTLDGRRVALGDLRGRVVVLNFWATWCGPCRVEMPELERYQAQMGDRVAVLGINMQESPSAIAPFVSQYGLAFPILLDQDGSVASPYRVTGLPTSVIVDHAGVIRERVVGPMTYETLARRVEQLL
jgi:cytochrome c biogenesis protein CcmG/thiol:disulfide interchange protein DsbE